MNTLQEATDRICELKGDLIALDVVLASLSQVMQPELRAAWLKGLDAASEFASTVLMNSAVSDLTIDSYQRESSRWRRLLANQGRPGGSAVAVPLNTLSDAN